MNLIKNLILAMRPKQWTKNFLLFAGLIFSNNLNNIPLLIRAILGCVIFCLLSGAVYLINDVKDIASDRNHPRKKKRPIASGKLPVNVAVFASFFIFTVCSVVSFYFNIGFGICSVVYFIMILSYSLFIKHLVIVDIIVLALGFVIRAIAGIEIIQTPTLHPEITPWFIICTMFLALFIGICKRRHELLLSENGTTSIRPVLNEYSRELLDQMVATTTSGTLISYALWCTQSEMGKKFKGLLVYTLPFVIYGIFRYLYITYKKEDSGAPEEVLLKDKMLLGNIFLWLITAVVILYYGKY